MEIGADIRRSVTDLEEGPRFLTDDLAANLLLIASIDLHLPFYLSWIVPNIEICD